MENQMKVSDKNTRQIGKNTINQTTVTQAKLKTTYWKIKRVGTLLIAIAAVSLFTLSFRTRKTSVSNNSIPVHTSSTVSTSRTGSTPNQISSDLSSSSLPICNKGELPNLSFVKSLDDKNEVWEITNGQKNLQRTWPNNEKQNITGLWAAITPKELSIDKQYYSVQGYASLLLNDPQKTPIYGASENEVIETIIYSSEDKTDADSIYFSVLQGKPTPDTNYLMDIYKFDMKSKQKTIIASLSSKDYFGNEQPGFSSVEADGRFLVTNQTRLTSGRGGCGADIAKFYDLTTQKFLTTTHPGEIDCGKEYIFKPNSSEFILVTGPVLIMDSPQKDEKVQIFKGRFGINPPQEEKEILREFSIEDYGAIYEIYEVNFTKEELYAKVRNPHTELSPYSIIKIPFNQQQPIEKVFDFQNYNYEVQAKVFSSNQGILISNLFLNKQGSIQNYEVNNWTGGVLIAIDFTNNCWQELDRVERKTWHNYWEGYPEVKLSL